MENETRSEQASRKASECREACSGDDEAAMCLREAAPGSSERDEVKRTVRSLVERFRLSREDLVSAYDECVQERYVHEVRVERNDAGAIEQRAPEPTAQQADVTHRETAPANCSDAAVQENGTPEAADAAAVMDVQEEGEDEQSEEEEDSANIGSEQMETKKLEKENGACGESSSESDYSPGLEEKEEVDKMQSLVQSALRVYEASSELGQKRRCFTLEDEISLQPSPFAQELLE